MFVPAGLTTDQRGFPRTTTYVISGSQTTCVDAGAVQTNYQSVQFSNPVYSSAQNLPVSPAPVVTVIENGQSIGGVPITLLFSGALNTCPDWDR